MTGMPNTELAVDVLREAAENYADALDAARTATDDYPGDETVLVAPGKFGLTLLDSHDGWTLTLTLADEPGRTVDVSWSAANYFWHVD